MATTDTFTTRSLDDYVPSGVCPQSSHSWEHERKGLTIERSYVLNHVDETCPDYSGALAVGLAYVEGDAETGWPCSTCWVDGKRADDLPNGDQRDSIDAPANGGGARSTSSGTSVAPTDKQVRFLTALVRSSVAVTPEWLDGTLSADDAEGVVYLVAAAAETGKAASSAIDTLLGRGLRPTWDALVAAPVDAPAPAAAAPARSNRYAAACVDCGGEVPAETGSLTKGASGRWEVRHVGGCAAPAAAEGSLDLSSLPEGRYAVPGGETRLKVQVDKPSSGRWAGFVFVRDAAEYGEGRRYGRQQPGSLYVGAIEDELAAIIADPAAASLAYGRLVGRCGVCNRTLEDERSVERGIGPVCAQRMGW